MWIEFDIKLASFITFVFHKSGCIVITVISYYLSFLRHRIISDHDVHLLTSSTTSFHRIFTELPLGGDMRDRVCWLVGCLAGMLDQHQVGAYHSAAALELRGRSAATIFLAANAVAAVVAVNQIDEAENRSWAQAPPTRPGTR